MSLLVRSSVPRITTGGMNVEEASAEWIGFATTMSFLAGLIQVVMGVFGLGVFVQLVSEPVMSGFVTASALLMMASQSSALLGLTKCNPSDLLGEGHDYDECYIQEYIASLVKHVDNIHGTTVLLSALTLASLFGIKFCFSKSRPRLSRLGPILVVALWMPFFYGCAKEWGTTTDEKGRVFDEKFNVRLVGPIPSGLPKPSSPFDSVPTFRDVMSVFSSSVMIAIIGFMESMAIAASVARSTKHGKLIPSRELIGIGASNLLCSVTKGYPITGSFSRTVVNADSGARTQYSSLVSGLVVALILLVFSDAMQYMPKFALAAIVFSSVIPLIKPREALFLYRTNVLDFSSFTVVVLVTLFTGFERGLICGILLCWIGTMMRRQPPRVELLRLLPQVEATSGKRFVDVPSSGFNACDVAILKIDPSLIFSTVAQAEHAFDSAFGMFRPNCIVLDMSKCTTIDASGLHQLELFAEFAHDALPKGCDFVLVAGLHGEARRIVEKAQNAQPDLRWNLAPVVGGIGEGFAPRLLAFPTIAQALNFARPRLESKDIDSPSETMSKEAHEFLDHARNAAWRQDANVADAEPGWRIPSFARSVPFELIVAKEYVSPF